MADSVTRITHQSWGSRMGDSVKGVCCGVVFVFVGIWFLVWNEGNSVAAHKALYEGEKLTEELPTADKVDNNFEGKLVHVSGLAKTESDVSDQLFGVTLSETLKLKRAVEMYQWVENQKEETTKNTGGSTTTKTTFTYTREWLSYYVSSSSFEETEGHENPGSFPYDQLVVVADPITLGAFTLSQVITGQMNWYQQLTTSPSVNSIPQETKDGAGSITNYQGKGFYIGSGGGSNGNPHVGDVRISFASVPSQTISVVARQSANSFSKYTTSNGRTIVLVEAGQVSTEDMFLHANQAVTMMTWIFRLIGLIVLWASLHNIIRPFSVFADVLPVLGDCVEGISSVVSFLVALAVWLVTIALAWLLYRPFLSIFLLALVSGAGFYLYKKKQERDGSGAIPVAHAYAVPGSDDLEMQATK